MKISHNISSKFEIIGHRGNPGNPLNSINIENTIQSFQSALDLGAHRIELDVILSKDLKKLVHHDDFTGRVFFIPGESKQNLVSEYTYDELQKAQININGLKEALQKKGSQLTSKIEHARIPLLEEILIPKGTKLFIELKFLNDKLPQDNKYLKEMVKEVVEFITTKGLIEQTCVLCFVVEALDEVKKLNNKITTAHNIYQGEANDLQKIKQLKKDYGFDIMNPCLDQATKKAIENIHSEGLKTYPWTWKESPEEEIVEIKRLIIDGADGAITYQAETAIDVLSKFSPKIQ
ncbi:MAG: hypothetical protein HY094_03115 [Candidatus Melainabacteria bacterium]|nr:hypothetical protein [Candidatus Melainabacteria bacterium]